MSYRDYSTEAVKDIMEKVSKSHQMSGTDQYELTLLQETVADYSEDENHIEEFDEIFSHSGQAEINRLNKTHVYIEKWFESDHSLTAIWNEILPELEDYFEDEGTSGEVKKYSSKMMWTYTDLSNHDIIFSVSKIKHFVNLKVRKRIGFWSAATQGILHASYISLMISGFIYGIFNPSLALSISVLILSWAVLASIIYPISLSARKKEQKRLTEFLNTLATSFGHSSDL